MTTILDNIQNQLKTVNELKYIDEDWGQLDYYAPNFPVQWPCALTDVSNVNYSDIGIKKTAIPTNRQQADCTFSLTIANLKLTNTSGFAPQQQKASAFNIQTLIEDVHKVLQGFRPGPNASALIRTSRTRIKRDDGVQEYNVTYSFGLNDV